MPRKPSPLLCELHAHTTWSDGALSLRELVDLYGRSGFDVLAVTDHTVRAPSDCPTVRRDNHADYLAAVEAEAERARRLYDLLALPGLELTYDDPDPFQPETSIAQSTSRHGRRCFPARSTKTPWSSTSAADGRRTSPQLLAFPVVEIAA